MNALLKDAVREEVRRLVPPSLLANESALTTSASSSSDSTSSLTVARLTGLLKRVRHGDRGGGRKPKQSREHRLQVRWLHYNDISKEFEPVNQRSGNRYVVYGGNKQLTLDELKQKAAALFFPNGKNQFAGSLEGMLVNICDSTRSTVFKFPHAGTVDDYI